MHLQPETVRQRSPFAQGCQFHLGFGQAPLGVQLGVMPGVQFDHRRPDPRRSLDLARVVAAVVELHTGHYSDLHAEGRLAEAEEELAALRKGAALAYRLGLEVHAGHGLTYDNVFPIAAIPQVMELNIGHFLIGEAIFIGLEEAMTEMRYRMDQARAQL